MKIIFPIHPVVIASFEELCGRVNQIKTGLKETTKWALRKTRN